ncbi:hypothetical protein ACHAWF_002042 [Thalassiosira exigua]
MRSSRYDATTKRREGVTKRAKVWYELAIVSRLILLSRASRFRLRQFPRPRIDDKRDPSSIQGEPATMPTLSSTLEEKESFLDRTPARPSSDPTTRPPPSRWSSRITDNMA